MFSLGFTFPLGRAIKNQETGVRLGLCPRRHRDETTRRLLMGSMATARQAAANVRSPERPLWGDVSVRQAVVNKDRCLLWERKSRCLPDPRRRGPARCNSVFEP